MPKLKRADGFLDGDHRVPFLRIWHSTDLNNMAKFWVWKSGMAKAMSSGPF